MVNVSTAARRGMLLPSLLASLLLPRLLALLGAGRS